MSDNTLIEWTDATWNVVNGCSVTSPGCKHCYAMKLAGTRLRNHPSRKGLTIDTANGPVWTGETRFNEKALLDPLKWKRPRRIFVCAHGDLFHESVPDEWIDRVFAVMALCPQHQFQVLTKRSDRMLAYCNDARTPGRIARAVVDLLIVGSIKGNRDYWPVISVGDVDDPDDIKVLWPRSNVWLGVSVEDQRRASVRIPDLLATPAAKRFLSCEPLLGALDLTKLQPPRCTWLDALTGRMHAGPSVFRAFDRGLDWVICGGESGPGARPMHPDWARSLRDQCAEAGVPFFFKQWGAFAPGEVAGDYLDPGKPAKGMSYFNDHWHECWSEVEMHCDDEPDVYRIGKKRAGNKLDGRHHLEMPA